MGSVLCDPEFPVPITNSIRAQIITFTLQQPIFEGQMVEIHTPNIHEPAIISKLISILDKESGKIKKKNPRLIK